MIEPSEKTPLTTSRLPLPHYQDAKGVRKSRSDQKLDRSPLQSQNTSVDEVSREEDDDVHKLTSFLTISGRHGYEKPTCLYFIYAVWHWLTIEPAIVLYFVGDTLRNRALASYVFWARCQHFIQEERSLIQDALLSQNDTNFIPTANSDFCLYLNRYDVDNTTTELINNDIALRDIWLRVIDLFAVFVCLLIATDSDVNGLRKWGLTWNLANRLTSFYSILMMITLQTHGYSIWGSMFAAEVADATGGGAMLFFGLTVSIAVDLCRYYDDDTSPRIYNDTRLVMPLRLLTVAIAKKLGCLVGYVMYEIFGAVLNAGTPDAFSILVAIAATFLSLIYVIYGVVETNPIPSDLLASDSDPIFVRARISNAWETLQRNVIEIPTVFTKSRNGNYRLCLNGTILIVCVCSAIMATDYDILMAQLLRSPLSWENYDVIWLIIYASVMSLMGIIVIPLVLLKIRNGDTDRETKVSLMVLGGYIALIIKTLWFSLSKNTAMLYIGATFSIITAIALPAYISFVSRMVSKNESARTFTALGASITICPVLAYDIFYNISEATDSSWLGIIFLIMAFVLVPFVGFYGYIYKLAKETRELLKENSIPTGYSPYGSIRQGRNRRIN